MASRARLETAIRFREDMRRLLRCVGGLSEAQKQAVIYGGWTARETLVHVAAWDRELVRGLDELLAERRPTLAGYKEAEFNARAVDGARSQSVADALAEAGRAHEALVARIEALTDEQWQRSTAHRWGNMTPMTIASLFDYTYRGETHYGGHAAEIETWEAAAT